MNLVSRFTVKELHSNLTIAYHIQFDELVVFPSLSQSSVFLAQMMGRPGSTAHVIDILATTHLMFAGDYWIPYIGYFSQESNFCIFRSQVESVRI